MAWHREQSGTPGAKRAISAAAAPLGRGGARAGGEARAGKRGRRSTRKQITPIDYTKLPTLQCNSLDTAQTKAALPF